MSTERSDAGGFIPPAADIRNPDRVDAVSGNKTSRELQTPPRQSKPHIIYDRRTSVATVLYYDAAAEQHAEAAVPIPDAPKQTLFLAVAGDTKRSHGADELAQRLHPDSGPRSAGQHMLGIRKLFAASLPEEISLIDVTPPLKRDGGSDYRLNADVSIVESPPEEPIETGPRYDKNRPTIYVNRTDDATTFMFVRPDGTVRLREFQNLPQNNRKAIVDYMVDHPDSFRQKDIAPHANNSVSPSMFSMQTANIRDDLDEIFLELYGVPLFKAQKEGKDVTGQKGGARNREYVFEANIVEVDASAEELQEAVFVSVRPESELVQPPSPAHIHVSLVGMVEAVGIVPSPILSIEERRRNEIDPNLPTIQVLREDDFALVVIPKEDGHSIITIQGENQLAVFDYLVDHRKESITTNDISQETDLPVGDSSYILRQFRTQLAEKLGENTILEITNNSKNTTHRLAANVTSITASDIISGNVPYERVNDPEDAIAILGFADGRFLQMQTKLARILEQIPSGEEYAVGMPEIAQRVWPDIPPSEINMDSFRSLYSQVTRIIKQQQGPQIQTKREIVNGRIRRKPYFAEGMMTSRPDYQGFTFDGLAGAIPLEKDMPIPLPVSKRSAGQQESTKESAEAERVPQSMVYYKNKRSGTLTCDGETFDFVLSRKEAAMLSLLMEQPGVPWEASGLQSKAKEVGIIQFWNSVRSLGGKLEPETSSFMSAVRIVYGETLDTSIITLLMDSIEVRTGRQAPQIFTAPWFENPPVFPTEKQKSEPDAAKHKGIIDIVPEPVRAKRLGELTDPQKSSVDRFTAVLSEAAMRGEQYVTLAEMRREMSGETLRTRMTHDDIMNILLTAMRVRGIEGKQTGRHVLAKYTPSDRLLGYYFGIPGEAAPAPDKPLPPALPAERKTDQEPSLPIEVQPFEFVSEQAHGQQIRVTIRNRGTGTQYILTDSTAYLFLNLRVGSANITTPEELEEALAVHLTDKQDIGTRVRKAQANSAHNDFPYQIQVKKSSNYREIIGYYLEQESNETEIEIGQARSVVPERDKSINYSTKSGFTTHELSTLAWSLLADPTIRQTFLKTRTPFFPSEEMLQAIIAENGFPTSEPPSAEAIGAILEKAQDKIAELYYDTKLYDQLQFRKKDDMWALMVGLVMVDRMTFKSNAGTISGLLYIAEAYQEPEQAALREIIPADRYRERTVFTQNQVLEKLDRIFAKQRIVFDEARNTTEDAETFDLDDL